MQYHLWIPVKVWQQIDIEADSPEEAIAIYKEWDFWDSGTISRGDEEWGDWSDDENEWELYDEKGDTMEWNQS